MHPRINELLIQAEINFGNFESVTIDTEQAEKFARLIVDECLAAPQVYLLYKKNNHEYESQQELHGWTNNLSLAKQWRESSTRDAARDFTSLYFVKKIESL